MNDKLLMENYLLVLKSTVEVYVHGTLESTNENVRNTLKTLLNDTLSMQASTYDLMKDNGWYNNENVADGEIERVYQKVINEVDEDES